MATLTHIRKHSIVHLAALITRNCRLTNHCTLCSLTNTRCSVPLQNQVKAMPPVCLPSGLRRSLRSEERRVGNECVSTCRSRGSPKHSTNKRAITAKDNIIYKNENKL